MAFLASLYGHAYGVDGVRHRLVTAASRPVTEAWGGWGPEVRDNPFPVLDQLRREAPVCPVRLADGHEAWLVLGHTAAQQALQDPRLSKDLVAALDSDPDTVDEGLPGRAFARHMLNVDGPDHIRLKGLVSFAFRPSRVRGMAPRIETLADVLLDAIDPDTTVDLVAAYLRPLPFQVIGELLGIPEADRSQLHDWFALLLSPRTGLPAPEVIAASDGIVGYLTALVDRATSAPGDDLVGDLVRASEDGDVLTRQELLSTLFQLVVAGHDTTTSLLGNAVVALLDQPSAWQALVADPSLMPHAVEELIRFTAPVPHATFRYATEDVALDGVTVPAGKQVLVCLAAANRDPALTDSPERLDLGREERRHLGFGYGPHFCLGAALARLEATIALTRLLERFPALTLATDRANLAWSHGDGLVLRGLAALPVRLS